MKHTHAGLTSLKHALGVRLSSLIETRKNTFTFKELSILLDVSSTTIYNVLHYGGEKCSLDMLLYIADELNLPYEMTIKNTSNGKEITGVLEPISEILRKGESLIPVKKKH